jgi:spore coat protein U-like protein
MRTLKTLSCVTAGGLLALAGGAQAAIRTANFNVSANVVANCQVTATDLAFGAFDGETTINSTSTVGVRCTTGSPYTLSMNVGTGGGSYAARTLANGANTLLYQLYRNPARTEIWGDGTASTFTVGGTGAGMGATNAFNHTVFGALPAAGNENAQSGLTYASVVQVTVTY